MNINVTLFKQHINDGTLEKSRDSEGNINLSHYVYNNQRNTRLWHYVNKDVYIEFKPEDRHFFFEDYGNGTPNWAYDTVLAMQKLFRAEKGGVF